MFVNMLAMRNQPTPGKSFAAFLQEVKTGVLEADENQDYPFEELVKNLNLQGDESRNPIFDVAITLLPSPETKGVGDGKLSVIPYIVENRVSRFDMLLGASEIEGKIRLDLEYSTALFKDSSVQQFLRHYREIMQQVMEQTGIQLKDIIISTHLKEAMSRDRHIDFGF
jgi:tyrocidine synthetase-3